MPQGRSCRICCPSWNGGNKDRKRKEYSLRFLLCKNWELLFPFFISYAILKRKGCERR